MLQLVAAKLHAHVRRKLRSDPVVGGIALSPREYECLFGADEGKSRWESGRILSLGRRTVKFHLDNARHKLGVATLVQAVGLTAQHTARKYCSG